MGFWITGFKVEAQIEPQNTIPVADTRNTPTTPDSYLSMVGFNFKTSAVIGLPATVGNFATLMSIRGWGDNSGGKAHELAFADNNSLYIRSGFSPNWENWRRMISEDVNGNVGIGTTSPSSNFHIASNVGVSKILIDNNSGNATSFKLETGNGYHTLGTVTNHPLVFATNNTEAMRIQPNGNVVISTSGTNANLQVVGNAYINNSIQASNFVSTISSLGDAFTYDNQTINHYGLKWAGDSWQTGAPTAWFSGYGGIKFFTTGSPKMVINNIGNVGIGTTNPVASLHIAGAGSNTIRMFASEGYYSEIINSQNSDEAFVIKQHGHNHRH